MTTGPIVPPNQFGVASQIGNEPQMLANAWLPSGPAMLFCPADRPERYQKALERADVVILDLEDAVAPENRTDAREALILSLIHISEPTRPY